MRRSEERLTCVVCKRRMYRLAAAFADEVGALGLVTGESLGQVASQTLDNLAVLDGAVDVPVFRPLIGLDKEEIIGIARRIGTFTPSIAPGRGCRAVPDVAATKAVLAEVEGIEARPIVSVRCARPIPRRLGDPDLHDAVLPVDGAAPLTLNEQPPSGWSRTRPMPRASSGEAPALYPVSDFFVLVKTMGDEKVWTSGRTDEREREGTLHVMSGGVISNPSTGRGPGGEDRHLLKDRGQIALTAPLPLSARLRAPAGHVGFDHEPAVAAAHRIAGRLVDRHRPAVVGFEDGREQAPLEGTGRPAQVREVHALEAVVHDELERGHGADLEPPERVPVPEFRSLSSSASSVMPTKVRVSRWPSPFPAAWRTGSILMPTPSRLTRIDRSMAR